MNDARNDARLPSRDDILKAKLEAIARALPALPAWHAALARISAPSSHEDRLAVYQAVRGSGNLPTDAGFFLVAGEIDDLVSSLPQPKLQEFEVTMQAIMEAHGLEEDDFWEKGEAPAEYLEAHRQYMEVWNQLYLAELLARGEHEIAQTFRDDHREYERRLEMGRKFLFGSITDNQEDLFRWTQALVNEVSACLEVISPMGPMGYRYHVEDDLVAIKVYPTPVELVGGPDDGGRVDPDFHIDLGELSDVFDDVLHMGWNALGMNDEEGPHISVEGKFRGQDVYLQLLARAPDDEEPGLKLNVTQFRRR
jgi:hypothetical protein